MMWGMLYAWLPLTCSLYGIEGRTSVGIKLCRDGCGTRTLNQSMQMNTFVCHLNTEAKRETGISDKNNEKHGSVSQVTGITCMSSTHHVEPWCVLGLSNPQPKPNVPACEVGSVGCECMPTVTGVSLTAECRVVTKKESGHLEGRSPGQYNTVVSNTKYSCTRRRPPNVPRCITGKGGGMEEGDEHTNSSAKKTPEKEATTKPTGYMELQAGKDKIHVKQYNICKTWDQASQQCRTDGGHLLKTDTNDKLKAIYSLQILGQHWIGLKDRHDDDNYIWIDGLPLNFEKWALGQPSHKSKDGLKENCVEVGHKGLFGLFWNDRSCDWLLPFLCQK